MPKTKTALSIVRIGLLLWSSLLTPALTRADVWSDWYRGPPEISNQHHCRGPIGGASCWGPYCDWMSHLCIEPALLQLTSPRYTTAQPLVSGHNALQQCLDADDWPVSIECWESGSRGCVRLSMMCAQGNKIAGGCRWIGPYSEEQGDIVWQPGFYLKSLRCSGQYCDNVYYEICTVAQKK